VYENPFAVPAAFVFDGEGGFDSTSEVSFEYVNDMYRFLSGIDRDVFIPLEYEGEYEVTADPDAVVFCELITGEEVGATIFMNGEEVSRYSQFLAPVQIRVPLDDEGRADVQLVFDGEELDVTRASFYMLDLDALAQVTEAIKQRGVQAEIGDGHVSAQVEGREGESLFISIPEENGWTVMRNGQEITPDLIGGALLSIPLENGSNDITMTYKVPGKTAGIVTSFAGVLMLACAIILERRKVTGGH